MGSVSTYYFLVNTFNKTRNSGRFQKANTSSKQCFKSDSFKLK